MNANDLIILDGVIEQQKNERAPILKLDEFFELFVSEQILKDYDLSYEELEYGLVGGGGDGGLDAIYTFVNGELMREDSDVGSIKRHVKIEIYFIQSKRASGFQEEPLHKAMVSLGDLLDLSKNLSEFNGIYNAAVIEKINIFRTIYTALAAKFPSLSFNYIYAARGHEIHPNVTRKATYLKEKIQTLFSASQVNVEFLTASKLLDLARRQAVTSYTLSLAENPISSSGDVGYVALVRLRDYFEFITDDNGQILKSLFESNVRDYQGMTEVNNEINNSLNQRSQEDFWWLNNGITIVAAKATLSGKTLTMEDPQIVNGLQTSNEIYLYFDEEAPEEEDVRNLLVRVIVPSAPESRDRIIKATNSQTYIPPASLRATDKIHRDIEEYFHPRSLFYDRRKNLHRNEGKPLDRIISIGAMAQAIMSILLQRPDTARATPSSMLKRTETYRTIFSEKYPIRIYFVSAFIMKKVDEFLREYTELHIKDRNNLKFYIAMYVVGLLCNSSTPKAEEISKIELPDDFLIKNLSVFARAFSSVRRLYEEGGETDQLVKSIPFRDQVRDNMIAAINIPLFNKEN